MFAYTRREFLAAGFVAAAFPLRTLADSKDLATLTLKQASDLIRRREVSALELTEACLKRIDAYNPALNAFVTVAREQAIEAARRLDSDRRSNRWRGPLHGIPIAFKDNIDTAGIRTTGASALFRDRVPEEDAEVVARAKRAGGIVLGKLNLHEFALGGTNAVTYFGPVHNPWAMDHHPGGSSGGNAAAVAADLCLATLATDTGGSIRIPASYCGIVGFKPTAGRVSNRGVIPNSWTFDTVGPMCKTVEDAALVLGVIAGYDEGDPTSIDTPVIDYTRSLRGRNADDGRCRVPYSAPGVRATTGSSCLGPWRRRRRCRFSQHVVLQLLWVARDFGPLWIHVLWSSHWPSNQRRSLRGGNCPCSCAGVRKDDRLAQASPVVDVK